MASVTLSFVGLGCEPVFRRHRSEKLVSEAAALAAAVLTGLGRACVLHLIRNHPANDIMPSMHHWFTTFTGYQRVQRRKRQW